MCTEIYFVIAYKCMGEMTMTLQYLMKNEMQHTSRKPSKGTWTKDIKDDK